MQDSRAGSLRNVLRVAKEMLEDRGDTDVRMCAVSPSEMLAASPVPGKTLVISSNRTDVHYYSAPGKVGVGFVRSVIKSGGTNVETPKRVIVISQSGVTPFTKKEFPGPDVQFFTDSFLRVNVTKHALVPSFTVRPTKASDEEIATLPRIFPSDPQAIYHDWELGTVVTFRRTFGGNSPIDYTRVVALGFPNS